MMAYSPAPCATPMHYLTRCLMNELLRPFTDQHADRLLHGPHTDGSIGVHG